MSAGPAKKSSELTVYFYSDAQDRFSIRLAGRGQIIVQVDVP